ncbi:MAG: T9SS type A sorting domain-containing protein [Taibaiella sp.]|nr:T9SS type A sorting domain-containing protein [Taibaiella sp.]
MKQNIFLSVLRKLMLLCVSSILTVTAVAQTTTSISGTVFNDANRNTRIDAGESFTNLPAPLYVYLVRANVIRAVATVASNGTYSLTGTTGFTYTLELSTQSYPNGTNVTTTPIDHSPPSGWVTTGENSSGTNTGNGDLNPNGIMQITLGMTALTGRNFGITCQSAGTSRSADICANEPSVMALADFINDEDAGGTWSYQSGSGITFDPVAATIQLGANPTTSTYRYDITGTGSCPASSSILTILIRPIPVSNQNLSICAGDSVCIVNVNTGSRTLNPNEKVCYTTAGTYTDTLKYASEYGCDSIVITNLTVNSCGTININGSVFNDVNTNRIIDAGEGFSSLPEPMYVYLVNSDNIVIGTAAVAVNGSYTIQGSPNQNYTLQLSTQQYPLGTKVTTTPINTIPPTGWVTTGENGNNNTGSGDGTPDGSLSLSLGTTTLNDQNFGIANSAPLAVNLLSFKASIINTMVQLDWATAGERNNKGFGIERSTDQTNWAEISFINSQSNSENVSTYRFIDRTAEQGKNFYRLKSLDLNGSLAYSSIAMITLNKDQQIMVYPNPATEALMVAGIEDSVLLSIVNALGQELKVPAVAVADKTARLDVSTLPAGVYYLMVKDQGRNVLSRQLFIKQ